MEIHAGTAASPAASEPSTDGNVRARILSHARKCFERAGFQKTTIEDIAAAAGIARQTIYNHFTGKQDIVDQITLNEVMKVQEDLRRQMRHFPRFADKTTEAILRSVLVARTNPYLQRTAVEEVPGPVHKWHGERWRSALENGLASGDLRPDLDLDDVVSWISFTQRMLQIRINQSEVDEDQLRRFIRTFIVEPILANHGAAPGAHEQAALQRKFAILNEILADQAIRIKELESELAKAKASVLERRMLPD